MAAMKKSVLYAIVGSLFFSFTFILNRSMSLSGGYYVWGAVLRYVYTIPILAIILTKQHKLKASLILIREQPLFWLLWSTVGFGLFYLPLSYASAYGESWLTASAWQMTIVAGAMLAPVFKEKIPIKNIGISLVILGGVVFMQYKNIATGNTGDILNIIIPILIAAFAYPLGNRMTMGRCDSDVDAMQRIFAMTICSMPFWMVCGIVSLIQGYVPTADQHVQSFLVALFSGVIATYSEASLDSYGSYDILFVMMSTVLLSPVAEEVIFRGYMLDTLLEVYPERASHLIATGIFALCHVNPVWICYAGVMGYLLSAVALREDGVYFVILCHMGFNLPSAIIYCTTTFCPGGAELLALVSVQVMILLTCTLLALGLAKHYRSQSGGHYQSIWRRN